MAQSALTLPRGRGRPASPQAFDLQRKILDHAGNLFAASGLDATGMQQIADAAGVDRRLVYHYFESKDKLYLQVLADIYGQLASISNRLAEDADTLEQFLEAVMRSLFHFCIEHPAFVRMLMWENLRGVRGLRTVPAASTVIDLSRQRIVPLIDQAVAAGRCRAGIDPELLLISCFGQCLYILSNADSLALLFDLDTHAPSTHERWIDHVTKLIIDGLRPADG